ncbi:MAG: diguanylate cyclase [Desulfobacterales bacterium]|nr:diguanylate cyclase [Desulfobacterales bacterium]
MDNRILIVDDDAAIRESMHEFVQRSGFQAFSAASAEEALDLLRTEAIHVVITDIILPGKDGLELTDRIKADYDIDVIVMTGYSGDYSYEEAVNKGASDFVFKPVRFEELLLRLKRVLKERQLKKERDRMLGKLQNLAITDGLTKLYNSRHFYSQLETEMGRSNRYRHALALLMLDIDHFKLYNDTYGHLEGDKVLVRMSEVIQSCLRTMDSAYRYGGEEFTIILPETGGEEAHHVAQRIRKTIETQDFNPEPGASVTVTVSTGVTQYAHGEEASAFVQRADQAMYTSKQKGRNQVSSAYAVRSQ